MSRVMIIAKREVGSLFVSPIAYVVIFLFLVFMGAMFVWRIFAPGELIELRRLADFSRFALFFVVPLLTMSLFSDEYKSGRIEVLRTSPINEFNLILGKFTGAALFFGVLLATTLLYLFTLMAYGRPDFGQVVACYIGMALMGCMFVSVGLFFSVCTAEQIVAAAATYLVLGLLTIVDIFAPNLPREWSLFTNADGSLWRPIPVRALVEYITVGSHIGDFTRGSIELGNVMYFGGISLLFLFWSYLVLESKKWR